MMKRTKKEKEPFYPCQRERSPQVPYWIVNVVKFIVFCSAVYLIYQLLK